MRYRIGAIISGICLLIALLVWIFGRPGPVQMGFVGGLTGAASDLGIASRNGAMLAVEQRNASGGVNGRKVNLVIMDDGQHKEKAVQVVDELIGRRIECIIGPATSSMAMVMIPRVNNSASILLSPTVTTAGLTGKDDPFVRVMADTSVYARKSAVFAFEKLAYRRVVALFDLDNRSYTESWLRDFSTHFRSLGGKMLAAESYHSSRKPAFSKLVISLLGHRPDMVLIVANAVDAAVISQYVRKQAAVDIFLSEWSATGRYIELAGAASEGVHMAQMMNRSDESERYRLFLKLYRERFGRDPGFASLAGYEAANVAMDAEAARNGGETLKQAIIRLGHFQGLQQVLQIDRFGDANRKSFVGVVRHGRFVTLE